MSTHLFIGGERAESNTLPLRTWATTTRQDHLALSALPMNKQMVPPHRIERYPSALQTIMRTSYTREAFIISYPDSNFKQRMRSTKQKKSSGSYLPELSHPNPANHTVNKWTAPIGCDRSSYKI